MIRASEVVSEPPPPLPQPSVSWKRWSLGAVALGALAGAAVTLVRAIEHAPAAASTAPLAFPVTCGARQHLDVRGVTHAGKGTLVVAEAECELSIVDAHLSGDQVLVVREGAKVRIENSTLEGKQSAVHVNGSARVRLRKAKLRAEAAALQIDGDAELEIEDSSLEGRQFGLRAGSNLRLRATRTRISGADSALQASSNLKLSGDRLTLRGQRAALESQASLRADLRACTLEGGETGVAVGLSSVMKLAEKSRLFAKGTAIRADADFELDLSESRVEGREHGLLADTNAILRLERQSELRGGKSAVEAQASLDLTLNGSSIRAEGTAVCSTLGVKIRATDSHIAGRVALRLERQPERLDLAPGTLQGESVFDAQGCEPASSDASAGGFGELAAAPTGNAKGAKGVPFNFAVANAELDMATRMATNCHASAGRSSTAIVIPNFTPDGRNLGARIKNPDEVGSAGECVLEHFRRVQIPAFDPAQKPGELFRIVAMKP